MINLHLPLSATALRLGSAFLEQLADQAEVIRSECNLFTAGELISYDVEPGITASAGGDTMAPLTAASTTGSTDFAELDEPEPVYETIVIGTDRNPDYIGDLVTFDQDALIAAGWTVDGLLANGYLIELTEQRLVTPAAPTPPAPGAGVVVDAEGFPWDSRIHSNAAEKLSAKGVWKVRKNLAPGVKEKVEAELRAVMAAGTSTTAPVIPAPPATAPAPNSAPAPTPAPPAPGAPTPTPPAPGSTSMTFPEFTRWAVDHINAKRLTQTDVTLAIQSHGLTIMPDLAKRPDLIPAVVASLTASKGL